MADSYDVMTGEVGLQASYRRSAEIGELFKAKAAAQLKIENATRDGKNPLFNSKYPTLGSVCDACLVALAEAGISVWQFPFNGDAETIGVTTLLGHASGQWIENTLSVRPAKFDAQGVGSVTTYLRRYTLMAIAGVAPDDDDGNAAIAAPSVRPAKFDAQGVGSVTTYQRAAAADSLNPGKVAFDWLGEKIRAAETIDALHLLDPKLIVEQRVPAWDTLRAAHENSYDRRVALWEERMAALSGSPRNDSGDL